MEGGLAREEAGRQLQAALERRVAAAARVAAGLLASLAGTARRLCDARARVGELEGAVASGQELQRKTVSELLHANELLQGSNRLNASLNERIEENRKWLLEERLARARAQEEASLMASMLNQEALLSSKTHTRTYTQHWGIVNTHTNNVHRRNAHSLSL